MITMKRDQLMIEQYRRIRRAQSDQVEVEMEGYVLIIEGSDLVMQAMTKDETGHAAGVYERRLRKALTKCVSLM